MVDETSLRYLRLIFKRLWLLVLAGLITGGISYGLQSGEELRYEASARLFIGNSTDPTAGASGRTIADDRSLAIVYSRLITFDLREAVIRKMGLEDTLSENQLRASMSTGVERDAPILGITVELNDAQLAADVANALAEELILRVSQLSPDDAAQLATLSTQLEELEQQIGITRNQSLRVLEQLNTETFEQDLTATDVAAMTQTNLPTITPTATDTPTATASPTATSPGAAQTRAVAASLSIITITETADPLNLTVLNLTETQEATTPTATFTPEPTLTPLPTQPPPDQVTVLTNRYNQLVDQLNASQATFSQLSSTMLQLSSQAELITLVEPARPNTNPTGLNPIIVGVLGVMVGGLLALVGVLFFEYINITVRTDDDVLQLLNLPFLGAIGQGGRIGKNYGKYRVVQREPTSRCAEDFRRIRTNLLVDRSGDRGLFLIASPDSGEGRTFVAANLATTVAERGLKTLLVDADLRNPTLHRVFEKDNVRGLSSLLQKFLEDEELAEQDAKLREDLDAFIQPVEDTPNLSVITSGLDGSEFSLRLLEWDTLRRCIDAVGRLFDYDVILFDTSPSLAVTDSYVLAATLETNVILVLEASATNRNHAQDVKLQFERVSPKISGVVLNKSRDG